MRTRNTQKILRLGLSNNLKLMVVVHFLLSSDIIKTICHLKGSGHIFKPLKLVSDSCLKTPSLYLERWKVL